MLGCLEDQKLALAIVLLIFPIEPRSVDVNFSDGVIERGSVENALWPMYSQVLTPAVMEFCCEGSYLWAFGMYRTSQ